VCLIRVAETEVSVPFSQFFMSAFSAFHDWN
jgi:hypothetical protein